MSEGKKVLIVDDMPDIHWVLSKVLEEGGYQPISASNGREALEKIEKTQPEAILLDIKMPEMDGIDLLKEMKERQWGMPVIILTAFGEIQGAVEAMRLGAHDYLTKPFNNQDVLLRVQKVLKERERQEELDALKSQLGERINLSELIGSSDAIKKVFGQIRCVANTDFTVVLYGETGSGKELVARAIHNLSPRKDKNFVVVDCGSIPEPLLESELFGHEKGAFTGAYSTKEGQFELANKGTIFLDEIGNLPLLMQNKLLRVLQEKCIHRVGGKRDIKINIRVIVAGNERLEDLLTQNRFRRDLYHRLNEFTIEIPPLRERKDDILMLSQHFLELTNKELNKQVKGFTEESIEHLLSYPWPGNIRELKNVVRRAVLLTSDIIEPKHLLLPRNESWYPHAPHGVERLTKDGSPLKGIVRRAVEEVERKAILEVLRRTGGNKSEAARLLKIDYSTMHYKIKQYGIKLFNGTEEE
ncbi:MAG: Fis family transcriptional regulator [Planctomycetes bacterium RIFCSPHIGHO2_12_FULL_52_36]|nr:MAG: Fis family transcriptional regulator [Planctomycetes bacterium RIFCSPHIGHO2_02_FULL_52_58]OHB93128.1 MAG: Fis family transcriptional regulator [Planctomycetes bacterium RIFCSPHIGHO2_12_FULL_52_36]